MKKLLVLIGLIGSLSAGATATGVAWDISLLTDSIQVEAYNSNDISLSCSSSYSISVLDETGLVKGMKKVSFSNYTLHPRQSYTFEILKKNFPDNLTFQFGEIVKIDEPLNCFAFFPSAEAIQKAVEGALRNSDLETALLFRKYDLTPNNWVNPLMPNPYATPDYRKLKVIDVSSSLFNIPNAAEELKLNHIETDKTTFALEEAKSEPGSCKMRKSLKCGTEPLKTRSWYCGVGTNSPKGTVYQCGCSESVYDLEEPTGYRCLKPVMCTAPKEIATSLNECAHPAHGIGDAKSCLLKINNNGAFEPCQL